MSKGKDRGITRTHYFTGEFLNADDFATEQNYVRDIWAYHNRGLYLSGIARGLEIIWIKGENNLTVAKGLALDNGGRQIILEADTAMVPEGLDPGQYYLTIAYNEYFSDYSEESGTGGFKRVTEAPELQFQTTIADPGQTLFLAKVLIEPASTLKEVYTKGADYQRRYLETIIGATNYYLDDVPRERWPRIASTTFDQPSPFPYGLTLSAPRTLIQGTAATTDTLSVGLRAPTEVSGASLSVHGISHPGNGTISGSGLTVTTADSGAFDPPLSVGEQLIFENPLHPDEEIVRTVVQVLAKNQVKVDRPFQVPFTTVPYRYMKKALASFTTAGSRTVMEVGQAGNVGIGSKPSASPGDDFIVNVDSSGNVGIGLSAPTTALEVTGTVKASYFIGNGAQLAGVTGLWKRSPIHSQDIFYNQGRVAVGLPDPSTDPVAAALDVRHYHKVKGKGVISSFVASTHQVDTTPTEPYVVIGNQGTEFKTQIHVGDFLEVGSLSGDLAHAPEIKKQIIRVVKVLSETTLHLQAPFNPPLTDAEYYIISPLLAQFRADIPGQQPNPGANPAMDIFSDNTVTVNTAKPVLDKDKNPYQLTVNGTVYATNFQTGKNGGNGNIVGNTLTIHDTALIGDGTLPPNKGDLKCQTLLADQVSVGGVPAPGDGGIGCQDLSGGKVVGQTLVAGTMTSPKANFNAGGTVSLFNVPSPLPQLTQQNLTYKSPNPAATDGFLLGRIYGSNPTGPHPMGVAEATAGLGDTPGGHILARASGGIIISHIVYQKKGGLLALAPLSSTFMVPVPMNQHYWAQLAIPSHSYGGDIQVDLQWIPLGDLGNARALSTLPKPEPAPQARTNGFHTLIPFPHALAASQKRSRQMADLLEKASGKKLTDAVRKDLADQLNTLGLALPAKTPEERGTERERVHRLFHTIAGLAEKKLEDAAKKDLLSAWDKWKVLPTLEKDAPVPQKYKDVIGNLIGAFEKAMGHTLSDKLRKAIFDLLLEGLCRAL